ncbi:MAG: hypothetical protein GY720_22700, partial [bacterium]|nr:hypothetical protein [bacterium]
MQRQWVVVAAVCIASGPPMGMARADDVQVNTYTTDYQRSPEVALGKNGHFVVVWHSRGSGGTDSSFLSIQGQRYASDGSALGSEFQVNSHTTGTQRSASVAVGPDGDFVVVWDSSSSGGTDDSLSSI